MSVSHTFHFRLHGTTQIQSTSDDGICINLFPDGLGFAVESFHLTIVPWYCGALLSTAATFVAHVIVHVPTLYSKHTP